MNEQPISWNDEYEFIVRTNVANKTFVQGHRKPSLDEIGIEKLKQLKAEGLSNKEIAKIFSCSDRTIRRYLNSLS